jgi:hypothetical protein
VHNAGSLKEAVDHARCFCERHEEEDDLSD